MLQSFSAKVPLFVTILPAQQVNTVWGNTKREFDAKKTVCGRYPLDTITQIAEVI